MSEAIRLDFTTDPITRPLYDTPPIAIQRRRSDVKLRNCIAYMGTCGGPEDPDYRDDVMPAVRNHFEAQGTSFELEEYSPRVKKWGPENARTEKVYLAESKFVVLPALDSTAGQATTAETGFGLIGSILRGQEIFLHVGRGDEHGLRVGIGRQIVRNYLENLKPLQLSLGSHVCNSLDELTDKLAMVSHSHVQNSANPQQEQDGVVLIERPTLRPRIIIGGSGNWDLQHTILQKLPRRYSDLNKVQHTFSLGFDLNRRISIPAEIKMKTDSAVNLVAIDSNSERPGYGAVNEIGLLVTSSILRGQALGIYMEKHDSADNSPSNRQRTLVAHHLARLLQDFPDLTKQIVMFDNLTELAGWGETKLEEHHRWRTAIGLGI